MAMARSPIPPAPTVPAIAVNPRRDIRVIDEALIRLGRLSLMYTDMIISTGDSPIASAASIFPGSTSANACSTCLAKNGIHDKVSGTIAAVGPILVPTITLVNGATRARRMIKGMALNKFVSLSKIL